jgi:hypothetical protein
MHYHLSETHRVGALRLPKFSPKSERLNAKQLLGQRIEPPQVTITPERTKESDCGVTESPTRITLTIANPNKPSSLPNY